MNYSSTFEAHLRNPVRFQETIEERVFLLTDSHRSNVCLGTRYRKATPAYTMEEESTREGVHSNGSPKEWDFQYE